MESPSGNPVVEGRATPRLLPHCKALVNLLKDLNQQSMTYAGKPKMVCVE